MKEKLMRFMAGRYGGDRLNRFLCCASLVLLLLNLLLRSALLYLLAMAALVGCYARALSRNMERRRAENARYLRLEYRVLGAVRAWLERWRQRRDYRFFRCPACRAMLRVPRGKGKLRVTCRKCGNAFERKT